MGRISSYISSYIPYLFPIFLTIIYIYDITGTTDLSFRDNMCRICED